MKTLTVGYKKIFGNTSEDFLFQASTPHLNTTDKGLAVLLKSNLKVAYKNSKDEHKREQYYLLKELLKMSATATLTENHNNNMEGVMDIEKILSRNNAVSLIRIEKAKGNLPEELAQLFNVPERTDFHPEGNSGEHTLLALKEVEQEPAMIKYAMLVHDLGKIVTFNEQIAKNPEGDRTQMVKHFGHAEKGIPLVEKVSADFGVSAEYTEFATLVCKLHMKAHDLDKMKDGKLYEFNQEIPDKYFEPLMKCCLADALGRAVPESEKEQIRSDFSTKKHRLQEVRNYMETHPNEDKNTFANNFAKYKKENTNNKGEVYTN